MTCFRWLPLPCHLTFSMNSLEKKWKGNRRNPIRYKIRNFFDLCNLGFFCAKNDQKLDLQQKEITFFAHAIPRQWVQKRKHRLFYLLNIGAQMRWWQKPSSTGGPQSTMVSVLALHPVAPGLILGTPVPRFIKHWLVNGQWHSNEPI